MDISSWVAHHASWSPAKVALRFAAEETSYAQLEELVSGLARGLRDQLGLRPGERVAYLGWNSPAIVALLFACARLGAVFVPLNARLTVGELRKMVEDCQPRLLVIGPGLEEAADGVVGGMRGLPTTCIGGSRASGLDWTGLRAGPPLGCDAQRPLSTPLLLVYTSGTTGQPKGVVLTQEALFANAVNALHAFGMSAGDEVLTVIPMFHVGGLNIITTPALHIGATVTIHERFDPAATLAAIPRHRVNLLVLVPVLMQAMVADPGWAGTDLSSLRGLLAGSTTVHAEVIRPWAERGVAVLQVYGLTETCPIATVLPHADALRKPDSAGKPVLLCSARLVDADGRALPPGTPGEVMLRGPNVFAEYWGQPEATAAAFLDGWFRSGDVGVFDEEGFLFIVDRLKDVIIVGGSNVYPAELERVLAACDALVEYAVVGRPDAELGEVPVACVVPASGRRLSAGDVLALFREQVAEYKRPRDVRFLDALPRTALGKVRKDVLRQLV